jgi:hypothetical protein
VVWQIPEPAGPAILLVAALSRPDGSAEAPAGVASLPPAGHPVALATVGMKGGGYMIAQSLPPLYVLLPFASPSPLCSAMHYNFCKIHMTLNTTPAMAAGVTTKLWELEDIVALID